MALGAARTSVLRLVVVQAMSLALAGVAAGALAAWLLTRLMQKLLFGVVPSDPVTFAAGTILITLVAAAAAALPAFRATRVDPAVALRG